MPCWNMTRRKFLFGGTTGVVGAGIGAAGGELFLREFLDRDSFYLMGNDGARFNRRNYLAQRNPRMFLHFEDIRILPGWTYLVVLGESTMRGFGYDSEVCDYTVASPVTLVRNALEDQLREHKIVLLNRAFDGCILRNVRQMVSDLSVPKSQFIPLIYCANNLGLPQNLAALAFPQQHPWFDAFAQISQIGQELARFPLLSLEKKLQHSSKADGFPVEDAERKNAILQDMIQDMDRISNMVGGEVIWCTTIDNEYLAVSSFKSRKRMLPDDVARFMEYRKRACHYVLQGEPETAVEALDRMLAISEGEANTCYFKGTLLLQMGDAAGASKFFAEARDISPEGPRAFNDLNNAIRDHARKRNEQCLDFNKKITQESAAEFLDWVHPVFPFKTTQIAKLMADELSRIFGLGSYDLDKLVLKEEQIPVFEMASKWAVPYALSLWDPTTAFAHMRHLPRDSLQTQILEIIALVEDRRINDACDLLEKMLPKVNEGEINKAIDSVYVGFRKTISQVIDKYALLFEPHTSPLPLPTSLATSVQIGSPDDCSIFISGREVGAGELKCQVNMGSHVIVATNFDDCYAWCRAYVQKGTNNFSMHAYMYRFQKGTVHAGTDGRLAGVDNACIVRQGSSLCVIEQKPRGKETADNAVRLLMDEGKRLPYADELKGKPKDYTVILEPTPLHSLLRSLNNMRHPRDDAPPFDSTVLLPSQPWDEFVIDGNGKVRLLSYVDNRFILRGKVSAGYKAGFRGVVVLGIK